MAEAKHTPGPWKIEIDEGYCSAIVSEDGEIVCQFDQDPNKADGILIAAAPDLLEALKRCRFDSLNMSLADLDFCRAAFAKATGQT